MKLTDLRLLNRDDMARVEVTVSWEEIDRPPLTLYVETDQQFVADLSLEFDAFVAACAVPAMHLGERRVKVEGDVCPELVDGLQTVMRLLRGWYPASHPPVTIEAERGLKIRYPAKPARSAMLLSGGIDALSTLCRNRDYYPVDHPRSIRDAIFVLGWDLGGFQDHSPELFELARKNNSVVAENSGIDLIPARTNLADICREKELCAGKWHGGALLSISHLFTKRISRISIASSFDVATLKPHGSHPLIDPYYASSRLEVVHDGIHLTRKQKLEQVVSWEPAFQNIRVCRGKPTDGVNCGKCEKCIRTMIGLLALGELDRCRAFATKEVTPAMLEGIVFRHNYQLSCYEELVPLLLQRGRRDLVEVIDRKVQYFSPLFNRCLSGARSEWLGELSLFKQEIVTIIPEGESLILVDDGLLGGDVPAGRTALPFLEIDGQFGGPPQDAATAIAELERLRRGGARFVVFLWPAYWWLDYYREFEKYLRREFPCLVENDRMIAFDLH